MIKDTASVLSDKQINDYIKSLKKPYTICLYAFCAGIACLLLFIFFVSQSYDIREGNSLSGYIVAGIFFSFFMGIALVSLRRSRLKKLKAFVAENIISRYLNETFDECSYNHLARLDNNIITSNMHFKRRVDEIAGSDYIKGVYKGLELEMSDITLTEITVTRDKDGKRREHRNRFFKGLWCVCDFKKELSSDLWVTEKNALINLDFGLVKTDNVAFNKRFAVRTNNAHEAFYVLTPHMMEYIEKMDRVANAKTFLRFLQCGKVYIALNSRRDSFEFGLNSDIAKIRNTIKQDLDYITSLLDEIMSSSYYRK